MTVALFLKFSISTMCHYKIMTQSLKDQLSKVIYLYFHLYSCYIEVYIYILVKFCTSGFILSAATDMHFSSQCVITKAFLTPALSLYAVLTGIWFRDETRSQKQ
jgi:hypothetical protein